MMASISMPAIHAPQHAAQPHCLLSHAETLKYLYLLHSNASHLGDFFVFSTEGHLMAPLPNSQPLSSGKLPAQHATPA